MDAKRESSESSLGLRGPATGGAGHRGETGRAGETGVGAGDGGADVSQAAGQSPGDTATATAATVVNVKQDLLASKQQVADVLGMSIRTFERYLAKYPFSCSGKAGVVNGRWRVFRTDVYAWWAYVQRQEARHPEIRRMRPEEPPVVRDIKGR